MWAALRSSWTWGPKPYRASSGQAGLSGVATPFQGDSVLEGEVAWLGGDAAGPWWPGASGLPGREAKDTPFPARLEP